MQEVSYERRGAAAVVTIDRPERRNAVDGPTAQLLGEAYRAFVADDEARVPLPTPWGSRAFPRTPCWPTGARRFAGGEGRGGAGSAI